MQNQELKYEIDRLRATFQGADENKLSALDGLIEQAAYERIYLRRLNEQAIVTGLVKIHPNHPDVQTNLPVSKAIATHSAALTNIMFKLCRLLDVGTEEDDDGLSEFE